MSNTTDDSENERELELDAEYDDYQAAWAYGFVPPPPLPPAPAQAAPLATASSSDKGKGKAVEGSEEVKHTTLETVEEDTPERKRNKEQLTQLSALDDFTALSLLRNDPTPISSLPTHTKLVQSLRLLQQVYDKAHPVSLAPYAEQDLNVARAPDPFPTSAYAELLELLGGALADVASSPLAWAPSAGATRAKKTVYELQLERARLSLDPTREWTSPPSTANGWGSIPLYDEGMTKEQKEDMDLANLFADNTRAALLILRPPLFPSSDADPPTASDVAVDAASSHADSTTPSGPPPITRLPSELLSHIFSLARSLSEERLPIGGVGGGGYTDPIYDDQGYPRAGVPHRRRVPGMSSLEGSRTAGQRFALSLALVCKDWQAPARRIAFRSLHCRKTGQMQKLLELFETSPETVDLEWILHMNAKILKSPELGVNGLGVARVRGYNRYVGGGGAIWGGGGQLGVGSSSAALEKQEESSPGAIFAKLVGKAPRLKQLSVNIVGNPYSVGFGTRTVVAEFLEPPVLAALSNLPTLTSLSLEVAVDFEELELIMAGLPSLETLHLLAVDSINGSGAVASPNPHPATNLRSFTLGDSAQYRDLTSITDQQLAWLLEPSANAGRLQEVDITVLSTNGAGWGPLGGGLQPNQPPPFASALIADLLERSAGNLKRLALRDLSAVAIGGAHQSFGNAPHNGNFDHLLSLCTSLQELTIGFAYTGPGLLDSLRSSPNLTSLILLGTPVHTSADTFATRLEDPNGQFSKLGRLVVSGQWWAGRGQQGIVGAGAVGWSGASVRRVKAICKERKIYCSFASA